MQFLEFYIFPGYKNINRLVVKVLDSQSRGPAYWSTEKQKF